MNITQAQWLELGIKQGWCSPPVCAQHDGWPTTEAEDLEMEEGFDPCIHIIRPYRDEDEKNAVERNHSPSVWRKPGFIEEPF